ncbi:MAG TPA: hypothetical protein DD979_04035 [Gammaproteobacteria bacterium]|nr:hypothetical protein [Gammaproteobacteria bacterium]
MQRQSGQDAQDSDLKAVFRRQGEDAVPEDLDQRILAAAHSAVGAVPGEEAPSGRQPRWWYRGFAVAALVVLAVSLIPLMPSRQATELAAPPATSSDPVPVVAQVASAPAVDEARGRSVIAEERAPSSDAPAAYSVESAAKAEAMQARQNAPVARETRSREFAGEAAPAPVAADLADVAPAPEMDMAVADDVATARLAERPEEAVLELEDVLADDKGFGYRDYPESWLFYIRLLEEDDRIPRATAEWRLFQQAYPDYTPSKRLMPQLGVLPAAAPSDP